jgi:hypothetical protein
VTVVALLEDSMPIATVGNLASAAEPPTSTFRQERVIALQNPDGARGLETVNVSGSDETFIDGDVTIVDIVFITGERRAF